MVITSKVKSFVDCVPSLSIFLRAYLTQNKSEPDGYYFFNKFIPKLNIRFTGYDFGANFGVYSYYMKRYCNVVHSIEPNPFAFSFLKSWSKTHSHIKVYENAVSEEKNHLELVTPIIHGVYRHRLSSTEDSFLESKKNKTTDKLITIVDPLDLRDIGFSSDNQYTLFKCDIEGGEVNIKSMLRAALEKQAIGMIEASPNNTKNFSEFILSFRDVADIYVLYEKKFKKVSKNNLQTIQSSHFNYFFVSKILLSQNPWIAQEFK
ncbi:FkbM family methyltransferase [bacterium]|nr:FkbM family methyltransferase [bacterium]